jgi:hypothetical protein
MILAACRHVDSPSVPTSPLPTHSPSRTAPTYADTALLAGGERLRAQNGLEQTGGWRAMPASGAYTGRSTDPPASRTSVLPGSCEAGLVHADRDLDAVGHPHLDEDV